MTALGQKHKSLDIRFGRLLNFPWRDLRQI